MNDNFPSIDPADRYELVGLLKNAFRQLMLEIDGAVPAKVLAYDKDKRLASIQPLIPIVGTSGESTPRGPIDAVPVFIIGAGSYVLNFPIKAGDLGYIIACDRDMSNFLQTYDTARLSTYRIKTFSDCFFLPSVMRDFIIDEEDTERVVLQSTDGTVRVALGAGIVKVTVPSEGQIVLDGPTTITKKLTVSEGVEINGGLPYSLTVNGNTRVNGDIEATGSITPDVPP